MKYLLTLLTVPALAGVLNAQQQVQFSGKVENGGPTCYYCPGSKFVINYTHTGLTCNTNLTPFVGQSVSGTGIWNGSLTSPDIFVTSIQLAAERFSIGGNAEIGKKISFTAFGSPGNLAVILAAFKDGFFNVPGYGVIFLDLDSAFIIGDGVIDENGELDIKVDVPNNPTLIGLTLFAQAAVVDITGVGSFTNSDLKVIG